MSRPSGLNVTIGGGESDPSAPSDIEIVALSLLAGGALAIAIQSAEPHAWFWEYEPGDTFSYVQIAEAVRGGGLGALHGVKHFWGTGVLAAGIAAVGGIAELPSLILLCVASSLAAACMVRRLWGGWVAAYFCVVSGDWLQASYLGGSEPVFLLFLLAAFAAARERRWALAALAAAASSTIRPVGYLAVIALLAALARTEDRRGLLASAATALGVIAASFVPVAWIRGDPFAHVRGYAGDWRGGLPLSLPFVALVHGATEAPTAFAVVRPLAWVVVVLAGSAAALASARTRADLGHRSFEATFFVLYVAFLFCYRSIPWSWIEFPRFAIPILPFLLAISEPWLPRRRAALWLLAPVAGLAAAGRLLGFHVLWSRTPWP